MGVFPLTCAKEHISGLLNPDSIFKKRSQRVSEMIFAFLLLLWLFPGSFGGEHFLVETEDDDLAKGSDTKYSPLETKLVGGPVRLATCLRFALLWKGEEIEGLLLHVRQLQTLQTLCTLRRLKARTFNIQRGLQVLPPVRKRLCPVWILRKSVQGGQSS